MSNLQSFKNMSLEDKLSHLASNYNYEGLLILAGLWKLHQDKHPKTKSPNWSQYFNSSFPTELFDVYQQNWPLSDRDLTKYRIRIGYNFNGINIKHLEVEDFESVLKNNLSQEWFDKIVLHPKINEYLEKYTNIPHSWVSYFLNTKRLSPSIIAKVIINSDYLGITANYSYINNEIKNIDDDTIIMLVLEFGYNDKWLFKYDNGYSRKSLFQKSKDKVKIISTIVAEEHHLLLAQVPHEYFTEDIIRYACELGNRNIIKVILSKTTISPDNILLLCSGKFYGCLEEVVLKNPNSLTSKTLLTCSCSFSGNSQEEKLSIQKCLDLHKNVQLSEEDFMKCVNNENIRGLLMLKEYGKLPDFSRRFDKKFAESFYQLYPTELSSSPDNLTGKGKTHSLIHDLIDDDACWLKVQDKLEKCCTVHVAIKCEVLHYYLREKFGSSPVNEFYRAILGKDSVKLELNDNIDLNLVYKSKIICVDKEQHLNTSFIDEYIRNNIAYQSYPKSKYYIDKCKAEQCCMKLYPLNISSEELRSIILDCNSREIPTIPAYSQIFIILLKNKLSEKVSLSNKSITENQIKLFIDTLFSLHKSPYKTLFKFLRMYPNVLANICKLIPSDIKFNVNHLKSHDKFVALCNVYIHKHIDMSKYIYQLLKENYTYQQFSIWDAIIVRNKLSDSGLELFTQMVFENDDTEMYTRLGLSCSMDGLTVAIKYKAKNLCKHIANNL